MPPTPPAVPADLLAWAGPPEDVFGPNLRFRRASTVAGVLLVLLGLAFFVYGGLVAGPGGLPGSGLLIFLACLLMAVGTAAVVFPRRVPATWVFVCPRGVVRARGAAWDAVGWDEVMRVDDLAVSGRAVTIRQCRLVLAGGGEWGFLADYVADGPRLTEVLRRKVAGRR